MTAGPRFEYHWQDASVPEYRKPTKMSAPDYVDCLMSWIQAQLDDESVFPCKIGELRLRCSASANQLFDCSESAHTLYSSPPLTDPRRHLRISFPLPDRRTGLLLAPHEPNSQAYPSRKTSRRPSSRSCAGSSASTCTSTASTSPAVSQRSRPRFSLGRVCRPSALAHNPRTLPSRSSRAVLFSPASATAAALPKNNAVCALSLEAHLNTSYRHFLLFVTEFNLIDPKELAPLAELNDAILSEN